MIVGKPKRGPSGGGRFAVENSCSAMPKRLAPIPQIAKFAARVPGVDDLDRSASVILAGGSEA